MYSLLRPLLFSMSPERAHHVALAVLAQAPAASRWIAAPPPVLPSLRQTLWNMPFPHPVGLAAGLDKNAIAVDGLLSLGFAFVEVGTVTPKPQPGNRRPRLFRLREDEALINRMGFNNDGVDALVDRLRRRKHSGVVGVNLGKNKITPNELAVADYLTCLTAALPTADYIVINVSSPNTPGLRDLQGEATLLPLAAQVVEARNRLVSAGRCRPGKFPPVLVKLAPDLSNEAVAALGPALVAVGVDGFVATNTTIARHGLQSPIKHEAGGLSGRPLQSRSTEVIRLLYRAVSGRVPIIGSGGIFTADDAYAKIRAGASLVQIYTGFIYKGPGIIREICVGIADRLRRDGFETLTDAIGVDA